MRTTIDAAGRVVLPKALRLEIGMLPGEVEIVIDGDSLRVSPVCGDHLIDDDGLLLLPAGEPLSDDEVRDLRHADQR
jgi:bifunctional DNA-binding transcriptional regulator/antitoxin component of YhaV-PrlF toxin-antitoxin module